MSEGWIGADIGGTGIKVAPVDPTSGALLAGRVRLPTPRPATPERLIETLATAVEHVGGSEPIGVGFPGVIVGDRVAATTHMDQAWIGRDPAADFSAALGRPVVAANDADCAGLAEVRFGAGRGWDGVVLVLTFGTGIGSSLIVDGVLAPSTELGHIELWGRSAEDAVSARARDREGLKWKAWVEERLTPYLQSVIELICPDLIILGGGVSRRSHKWSTHLDIHVPVAVAALENDAGIVGAARLASEAFG